MLNPAVQQTFPSQEDDAFAAHFLRLSQFQTWINGLPTSFSPSRQFRIRLRMLQYPLRKFSYTHLIIILKYVTASVLGHLGTFQICVQKTLNTFVQLNIACLKHKPKALQKSCSNILSFWKKKNSPFLVDLVSRPGSFFYYLLNTYLCFLILWTVNTSFLKYITASKLPVSDLQGICCHLFWF